jgi:hypothetical protein
MPCRDIWLCSGVSESGSAATGGTFYLVEVSGESPTGLILATLDVALILITDFTRNVHRHEDLRALEPILEQEMNTVILSCTRARGQLFAETLSKPTVH